MTMVNTAEMTGRVLDWAVGYARCLEATGGKPILARDLMATAIRNGMASPSTDGAQGWPIIEQMRGIKLKSGRNPKAPCYAHIVGYNGVERWHQTGKTLLIAAMRCYVASKLGDKVDVPDELLEEATHPAPDEEHSSPKG